MNKQNISASHKIKYCEICKKNLLHKIVPEGNRMYWRCYGMNHGINYLFQQRNKNLEDMGWRNDFI